MTQYTKVHICLTGEQIQTWSKPVQDAYDFAADMYADCYKTRLGRYQGSQFIDNESDYGTRDNFEGGYIFIERTRD